MKPANCCAHAASAMEKGLDPEMWGEEWRMRQGRRSFTVTVWPAPCMCECILGLCKWQMPFQSQQREMVAPACGCASARVELGWFPTDKLVCTTVLGGWAGVGCRNSSAHPRSEMGMLGSSGGAE